jgi:hypothetical protein
MTEDPYQPGRRVRFAYRPPWPGTRQRATEPLTPGAVYTITGSEAGRLTLDGVPGRFRPVLFEAPDA